METNLRNIVLSGIALMLFMCSNQTLINIQKTLTDSIQKDNPSFTGDAYYSQAISFASYALSNWAAPSVISMIGSKFSMFIGAVLNVIFILQFLLPHTSIVYLMSVLVGFGTAVFWTAQGNYLILNSTEKTISRNTGIFTSIGNFNMIIGNVFVIFAFNGKEEIDESTRFYIVIILATFGVAGLVPVLFLPKIVEKDVEKSGPAKLPGPVKAFIGAVKLFFTPKILLLSLSFLFIGLELGFFGGVYSSCLGFTKKLNNRKTLVGVSGIFVGLGDVCCGAIFSIYGRKMEKWGRSKTLAIGCLVYVINCTLIFLNLPNDSTFSDTNSDTVIYSNVYLAILGAFLFGIGDAFYNNVVVSLLGTLYADNSASAFAIMQSCMAIGSIIIFVAGQLLGLYYQLVMLIAVAVLSTFFFYKVEYLCQKTDGVSKIEVLLSKHEKPLAEV